MMIVTSKVFQLLFIGSLSLLSELAHGQTLENPIIPAVGDEVCVSGYIMDFYCTDLGVLFENRDIPTLGATGPVQHSVHCLIDVPHCLASPFELLNKLEDGEEGFGRSWRVSSNDKLVAYAKQFGGCTDCDNLRGADGAISNGLQATIEGTLKTLGNSNTPPIIEVSSVHNITNASSICNGKTYAPPNGMVTTSGSLERKILIHGSLMLIGWGFLLPSGVIIAAFGKHHSWWFNAHRVIQPIGLLFALIAWIIALVNFDALNPAGAGTKLYSHAVLGMTTMVIGLIQPVNAIFRPHATEDGEEKSAIRLTWEIFHKGLGYIGLVLAVVTIGIGTTLIGNESHARAFQICYGAAVGGLLVILASFLFLQKRNTPN